MPKTENMVNYNQMRSIDPNKELKKYQTHQKDLELRRRNPNECQSTILILNECQHTICTLMQTINPNNKSFLKLK